MNQYSLQTTVEKFVFVFLDTLEFCNPDNIVTDLSSGFIISQNFPEHYDQFLDCDITILPADHELSLAVFVHEFHTERFDDILTFRTSYGTYEYHGNGNNIGSFPEAMEEGRTYYCE